MADERNAFHIGDRVVFSQDAGEHGQMFDQPRPVAIQHVNGVPDGVPAFGIIERVRGDGWLLARTADGGRELVRDNDPMLRHAAWWERLVYRAQFRGAESAGRPHEAVGQGAR